ncbi:hypothetical protein JCM33374_g4197 [Metschnikowia sp. JCM 33374]|nr:hypothetical protein JCM33374_g4197 [Metschnikowia sp. JCM 33374]
MSSRTPFTSLTSTSSPTGGSNTGFAIPSSLTGASFVGNTPSTVLFFLAMAVGVGIALLFVFFTIRYFIRAKFGLHLYSASHRGMMFSARSAPINNPVAYTDREIQEHLEYLRTHHFLRDDFLERRLYASSGRRRRRRRRRGRFAKMKKLSQEEVEKLFPKTRYADWLNTGDDGSSVSGQTTNNDSLSVSASTKVANHPTHQPASESHFDVVEMNEPVPSGSSHGRQSEIVSSDNSLRVKTELHFDSGSCSICLEVYESDDIVRGLICGHVFHADCVDPWLTRRRACCPICKRDYYKEEHSNRVRGSTVNIEGEEEEEDTGENLSDNLPGSSTDESPSDNVTPRPDIEPHNNGDTNIEPRARPSNGNTRGATLSMNEATEATETTDETTETTNEATNEPTNAEGEDDAPNSLQDLNYDVIRADSNIQALFNELIPLSERVRVLLDEYPHLNMDVRARQISKKKYGNIFKIMFWKLMGISKDDLYNWAVIKIYQEEQASSENEENAEDGQVPETNTGQPGVSEENVEGIAPGSEAVEVVEMREIRRLNSGTVPSTSEASSVYRNTEEDLADAARRREAVENRV